MILFTEKRKSKTSTGQVFWRWQIWLSTKMGEEISRGGSRSRVKVTGRKGQEHCSEKDQQRNLWFLSLIVLPLLSVIDRIFGSPLEFMC